MIKLFGIALFLTLLFTNCGYQVVKKSDSVNFNLIEVNTVGEKRVNYKLKSKLLLNSNKDGTNIYSVKLDTKKNKVVKERNIKNEITKYQVTLTTNVNLSEIGNKNSKTFSKSKTGEFSVFNQYSATLNNEKKLIEILTDELADEILDELSSEK